MTTLSGGFPLGCPTNANPYTIAVWEKIDTGCPNNGGFVGWGVNDNGEANDLRLNGANSADDYWYANDFVVTGLAANPMDGNWHAIAVTWDGTNETMYVDGVDAAERTPAPPNVQPSGFVVGRTTADNEFHGMAGGFADCQCRPDTGGYLPCIKPGDGCPPAPPIRCCPPRRLPTQFMPARR